MTKKSVSRIYSYPIFDRLDRLMNRQPKSVKNNCPNINNPFHEIKELLISSSDFVGMIRLMELSRVPVDVLSDHLLESTSLIERIANMWISFEKRATYAKRQYNLISKRNIEINRNLIKAQRMLRLLPTKIVADIDQIVEAQMQEEFLARELLKENKQKKFKLYAKEKS